MKAAGQDTLWSYDRSRLSGRIGLVGVDEAGRGALAGPVVAGAVFLPEAFFEDEAIRRAAAGIDDSKQLSAEQRERSYALVTSWEAEGRLSLATGSASVEEIEAFNILGATRLAMTRALEVLQERGRPAWRLEGSEADALFPLPLPGAAVEAHPLVLVDGRPLKPFSYRHEAVVRGDGLSLAIAMASVAAKVTRDRLMAQLASEFECYGFANNKGYGTIQHREALLEEGPCPHHRLRFLSRIQVDSEQTLKDGDLFECLPENPQES